MRATPFVVAIVILLAGVGLFLARPDRRADPPSGGIVVVRSAASPAPPAGAKPPAPPPVIRAASRDRNEWEAKSEAVLRAQMRQVPMLDVADNLQVSCAAARCEVAARLPAGLEGKNRAMYWRFIQGPAVRERMIELGLPLDRADLRPDDRFTLSFTKGA